MWYIIQKFINFIVFLNLHLNFVSCELFIYRSLRFVHLTLRTDSLKCYLVLVSICLHCGHGGSKLYIVYIKNSGFSRVSNVLTIKYWYSIFLNKGSAVKIPEVLESPNFITCLWRWIGEGKKSSLKLRYIRILKVPSIWIQIGGVFSCFGVC